MTEPESTPRRESLVEILADAMSVAYVRGVMRDIPESAEKEKIVARAADALSYDWLASAEYLLKTHGIKADLKK